MGCCFSFSPTDRTKPSANVVSAAGELRRYPLPVTVVEVLQSQPEGDSSFLCCSDRLYFDEYIPSLSPDDELEPAQIYFLLPASKLQYRLAAADLAALAVKASVAIDQVQGSGRRRRKSRISSVSATEGGQDRQSNRTVNSRLIGDRGGDDGGKSSAGLGILRSGSVRKLRSYSSRRAKLAVRSFRSKLSTIYEGSALNLI